MFSANRLKSDGDQKINRNFNMIKLFYQNKDFTTAKNYVTELLTLKPDSSEAYKLLSQINEAMGEHELAMQNYKKCLDLKVSYDPNSSFENNYHFTPTKVSSPVVNKNNHSNAQDNHVNHVAYENFEKLFEQKTSIFEKAFENINNQFFQLNENFSKNHEEISLFKKKLLEMQKKLTLFGTKQDEIINKLNVLSSRDDDKLKEQLATFSNALTNVSSENSKIVEELYDLKEIVKNLRDLKSDLSDYDEESYNDYEEEEPQTNFSSNQGPKPNLNELFKPNKDDWRCVTCDTPNSKSDLACQCCETLNPNASQPKVNGLDTSGNSPFKFGVPSNAPQFSFGTPSSKLATPSFPSFTNNSNLSFNVSSSTTATNEANALPSFGNFANSSSTLLNAKSNTPTNSITSTIPSFGINSNVSSNVNNKASAATPTIFGSEFSSLSNNLNTSLTTSKSTLPNVTPASSFSFSGVLNTLNNDTKPPSTTSAGNSIPFSFASTFTSSAAPVSLTNTNSFSFNLKTTSSDSSFSKTISNSGVSLLSSNGGSNVSTNQNTKPASSNFSFGNLSFSNNLFNQKPNFLNNDVKNDQNTNSASHDSSELNADNEPNQFENGGDSVQDGDYFKLPEVKMPEKYEQVTGEEDEETVFEKKSKLYIFKDGEYKERGVGIIKILKHNKTLKYRVLMRRDHIFKVCLNTHLTDLTNLEIVDKKFLRFSCIDFSEDKPASGVFLLKFGDVAILTELKSLIETLRNIKVESPKTSNSRESSNVNVVKNEENSEVELVYTKEPKAEHLEKISSLHLPVNFYDYEDKEPCKGCIGCKDDTISWDNLTRSESDKADAPETSNPDLGLFSSIATDLNVKENKVDSIASESFENDHTNDQNFVSEKSKLLPQNFEVKTGEEGEDIVFNERGKMFHFVSGEWKERGVGQMKILKQHDSNTYRLLMRRDRILNVICNHKISSNLQLGPFNNSNNTLTWFAKDYSEENGGLDELFALKFRNEPLMKQFEKTVNECIGKPST